MRFGLSLVHGLGDTSAEALARGREAALERLRGRDDEAGRLEALTAFVEASALPLRALRSLARAGAFDPLAGDRRRALWEVLRLARPRAGPLDRPPEPGPAPPLSPIEEGEIVIDDYASFGATTERHPMELLRERLDALSVVRARALARRRPGPVRVAGVVNSRQAPMTAKGFVFLSLEDETGMINVVVSPQLAAAQRRELVDHPVLLVEGELQRHQGALNVKARRLVPIRQVPGAASTKSHDFH